MPEYTAGSASVPITPDFKDFHTQVATELDGLDAQFAEAGDKSGASFGEAFQAQVKSSLADLPDATIKADADTTEADAELDDAAKTRTATVKVNVDKSSLSQAKSTLSGIGESGGKLLGNAGTLGAATAVIGLAPQAAGAALGAAGIGVGLAAAAGDAAAFGAVAVPMFTAVTAAQTKLTTAQQAYAKATTSSGQAAALKQEQAALAGLTPAEKQLATELSGLTTAWGQLQKAEQPVVGQALAPWLSTATSGMSLLKPLITDSAVALGGLGTQLQSALQSPFWQTFSATFGIVGSQAITDFGTAAGSVGDGLAHLFVTFAPDIDKLLSDIPALAGDFDNWAKSVTSGGLEDFFSKTFSHANLATLKTDLDSVGKFFSTVASATESMSPLAFSGMKVLLEAIGELPPDAVIALTALFLATKTLGAIGNLAGLANNVIGLGKAAAGALGLGGSAAEEEAEGTAAGSAAGTSAATAFTSTFSAEVTAALPAAFTEIGATGSTEATAAGTAMGTAAATSFGTSFGAESATVLTAELTAEDGAATVAAGAAGAAMGTALATGFGSSLGAIGTAVAADLPEAGVLALAGAAAAGAALGGAFGVGFTTALGISGASSAVGSLVNTAKSAVAGASSWLQPAGEQAADGFAAGFTSQASKVQGAAAQAKSWVTAGVSGSQTTLTPAGQNTMQGFITGLGQMQAKVNSELAGVKTWVTNNFQPAGAWLVNAGIDVLQGLLNGMISMSGSVISYASSLAGDVIGIINSALGNASPSKKTFASGQFVGQGLALGMLDQQSYVGAAGAQLAQASLAGMANAQSAAALASLGVPSAGGLARLPGVSSPLTAGPLQLQLSYAGSGNQLVDALVGSLRADVQAKAGGDVQNHLGYN